MTPRTPSKISLAGDRDQPRHASAMTGGWRFTPTPGRHGRQSVVWGLTTSLVVLFGVLLDPPDSRAAGQRPAAEPDEMEEAAGPAETFTVIGSVVKVDPGGPEPRLQITTLEGEVKTLELMPDISVVWRQGQPLLLEGLKRGQLVKVFYAKRKGKKGRRVRLIQILADTPQPPQPVPQPASGASPPSAAQGRSGQRSSSPGAETSQPLAPPPSGSRPAPDTTGSEEEIRPASLREGTREEHTTEMPEAPEMPIAPDLPDAVSPDARKIFR